MASPTVDHGGFLVPNAGGLTYPRMAEVDQIDFNTLAQAGWGVVEGCQVSVVSPAGVNVTAGTAVVNGKLVNVPASADQQLGQGLPRDRFDLVVVTSGGTIQVIPGIDAFDPILPDPTEEQTVLAAVFCPTGAPTYTDFVIDKRVMLPQAVFAKKGPSEPLVRNVGSGGVNVFTLRGDGRMDWGTDADGPAALYREASETLRVDKNLSVGETLKAAKLDAVTLYTKGLIDTLNFYTAENYRSPAQIGAIRTDPITGKAEIRTRDFGWVELATSRNATPIGTIVYSVLAPADMGSGWVQFAGQSVSEGDPQYANLWLLPQMAQYSSGTAPSRSMTMPDLTGLVVTGTKTGPIGVHGSDMHSLVLANLPAHKHNVSTDPNPDVVLTGADKDLLTGDAGGHSHHQTGGTGPNSNSGSHTHSVTDPGHAHNGMEGPGGTTSAVVALVWGGLNKLDALFNDRNHTHSVEPLHWTKTAFTKLTVNAGSSEHSHTLNTVLAHKHKITLPPLQGHQHRINESEVGSGTAFSVRQKEFTVFVYLKV